MASFFSCQYMRVHKHPPYKTICRVKLVTGLILENYACSL